LRKYGIPIEERLIQYGEFSREKAWRITQEFFSNEADVTAIFASSDMMAFGAIEGLKKRGYKVPKDIAVVGFDDIDMAELYKPALTTVHQQRHKMGETAVKMLINIIDEKENSLKSQHVKIPTYLVIRESCGAKLNNK